MREWYELLFTPDHAINKMKHYDNVTDLVIDGESFSHIKERMRAEAIDDVLFILYDKGYINSDDEEYIKELLKEKL